MQTSGLKIAAVSSPSDCLDAIFLDVFSILGLLSVKIDVVKFNLETVVLSVVNSPPAEIAALDNPLGRVIMTLFMEFIIRHAR